MTAGSAKALPDDFPVPGIDVVLGQAIPFDKDRWIPLLPDATWWPAELDDCPRVGRWPRVDRRTVFSSPAGLFGGGYSGRRKKVR
ncbi:hypothetical protein KPATCC21470_6405 [Kitasatospora purpeofusca]